MKAEDTDGSCDVFTTQAEHKRQDSSLGWNNCSTPLTNPNDSASIVMDKVSNLETKEGSSSRASFQEHLSSTNTFRPQPRASWQTIFWLIFKKTAPSVLFGTSLMILGIGLSQAVLLPHIHSCPKSAVCSAIFDPSRSNILTHLQTAMTYWTKVCMVISVYGLMKLSAYQALFALMKHGNTLDNVNIHLGAIKGGFIDATRLLLRPGNFMISFFILAALGVDTSTNFFVGQSIMRSPGIRNISFEYSASAQFPAVNTASLNSDGHLYAISKVIGWALSNDITHGGALHGTLVVPDGRTNYSLNPLYEVIEGALQCTAVNETNIVSAGNETVTNITITVGSRKYIALPNMQMAVTETDSNGIGKNRYLWFSNTIGVLPNATKINSTYYATMCEHQLTMNFWPSKSGAPKVGQEIEAGVANVEGCTSMDMETCIVDSVSKTILNWWGGIGQSFWGVNCRGGVLGPLNSDNMHNKPSAKADYYYIVIYRNVMANLTTFCPILVTPKTLPVNKIVSMYCLPRWST